MPKSLPQQLTFNLKFNVQLTFTWIYPKTITYV